LNIYELLDRDLHGSSWVDFDNDDDQDILIVAGAKKGQGSVPNLFLINNGEEKLEDQTEKFGLEYSEGRGRFPIWLDWDNNGLLDLILINANRDDGLNPTAFFEQKNGTFQLVKKFENIENIRAPAIFDYSLDGTADVLFLTSKRIIILEGNNLESPVILDEIKFQNTFTNDIVIGDFDGDTFQDFFITTGGILQKPLQNDILLKSTKNGFVDYSLESNLSNPTSCTGAVTGDFDNDMDLDIFLVCSIVGDPSSESSNENQNISNILYENLGNGTFSFVPNAGGAEGTEFGSAGSVSLADYDNDGFLDIFVTNGGGFYESPNTGPSQLFKNLGNELKWIEIDLIGSISNRDGIGTSIFLTAGNKTQIREQSGGVHYHAQDYQRIHFGLGKHSVVDEIIFHWPSGIVHNIENVQVNQIIEIIEPEIPLPPNHQIKLGIQPIDVLCKNGLELLIRSTSSNSICVSSSTAKELILKKLAFPLSEFN